MGGKQRLQCLWLDTMRSEEPNPSLFPTVHDGHPGRESKQKGHQKRVKVFHVEQSHTKKSDAAGRM